MIKSGCTLTSGPSFCFSFCFVLLFCFVFKCTMKREGALFVVRHQMQLFCFQSTYIDWLPSEVETAKFVKWYLVAIFRRFDANFRRYTLILGVLRTFWCLAELMLVLIFPLFPCLTTLWWKGHLKVGLGGEGLSSHGMRGARGGGGVVRGDVRAGRGDQALLLFHLGWR